MSIVPQLESMQQKFGFVPSPCKSRLVPVQEQTWDGNWHTVPVRSPCFQPTYYLRPTCDAASLDKLTATLPPPSGSRPFAAGSGWSSTT
jgi:hypothetical protein